MANASRTLLLTRPEGASRRFAAAVQGALGGGWRVVISPLMETRFLTVPLPDCDTLAFTSETAVRAVARLGTDRRALAWCVGPRTEEAARAAGYSTKRGGGTAEELVAAILADRPGGTVFCPRAQDQAVDVAILLNSAGIETLSRERIGHEMRRLLAAPDPSQSVAAMQATGILARVLPGADARALAPLVRLEPPYAPDWIRRLCVLGGTGHADGLRLSRAEARRAETLAAALAAGESAAVTAYRHGAEIARDVVLVMAASAGTEPPAGWEDRVAQGTTAVFPVASGDLMPVFSGAALGARLRELEERWIASGFELSREQLLA